MGYYDRLKRESDLVFHADPYRDGADPPEFSFDLSTHLYYHGVYERPGPVIDIYRLHDCEQGVGGKPLRAPVPPAVVEAERRRMAAG
jgi:hypothetical protein